MGREGTTAGSAVAVHLAASPAAVTGAGASRGMRTTADILRAGYAAQHQFDVKPQAIDMQVSGCAQELHITRLWLPHSNVWL